VAKKECSLYNHYYLLIILLLSVDPAPQWRNKLGILFRTGHAWVGIPMWLADHLYSVRLPPKIAMQCCRVDLPEGSPLLMMIIYTQTL